MTPPPQHHLSATIRHALWLALLMYVLVFIFWLFASSDTHADEGGRLSQTQLLYEVLGSLEYAGDGKFTPVAHVAVEQSLNELIKKHGFDHPEASVYVLNLSQNTFAWSAVAQPTQYDTSAVKADVYATQSTHDGETHLLVQNFWVKQDDGSHLDCRMVMVVPKD
jgi:hypothetical protein